jgi:hypothetical protein
MFRLPTQKPQPKVEQTEGYLLLPIVLGMLKGVLINDIIADDSSVRMALENLISKISKDKKIAFRIASLNKDFMTNGEAKKFVKMIDQSIRELSKKDIKEIVTLLKSKDTDIPLSEKEYASIVEQAYTVYLFCPTKRQVDIYRKEIEQFDEYLSYGKIVLVNSKDLGFFQKVPSVGYLYSPKEIETSEVNNQKRLKTITEVQKALDENLPSIRLA